MPLKFFAKKGRIEVGIDEVGRGCIAGRVYAAAVIIPPHGFSSYLASQIKDSKKLSRKKRAELKILIEKESLDFGIGYCEAEEVDELNILKATFEAMHRALDFLKVVPDFILIDGNSFTSQIADTYGHDIPYECVVKGDSIYMSIAAASILAKEEHDEYIEYLLSKNDKLKVYDWGHNMCYPTAKHLEAIKKYGLSEHHRKTFAPCKKVLDATAVITFPYKRNFLDTRLLWENAATLNLAFLQTPIFEEKLASLKIDEKIKPNRPACPNFEWQYDGKPTFIIIKDEAYEKIDKLVDYFSERQRMSSHKKGEISPLQYFEENRDILIKKVRRSIETSNFRRKLASDETSNFRRKLAFEETLNANFEHLLREEIYASAKECSAFKITVSKFIYQMFKSKVVLDPSAGWGDRLIGAAAAGVTTYHGVDPNSDLSTAYKEILEFLDAEGKIEFSESSRVITEDFLKVENLRSKERYDTVFTSPPFYDYEIYQEGVANASKQSIFGNDNLDKWLQNFMYPYLSKAWSYLNKEGVFLLYMCDVGRGGNVGHGGGEGDVSKYKYMEKILAYMKKIHATYKGVIGIRNFSAHPNRTFPLWVWKKI